MSTPETVNSTNRDGSDKVLRAHRTEPTIGQEVEIEGVGRGPIVLQTPDKVVVRLEDGLYDVPIGDLKPYDDRF